jgi:MSHA biogenesis protein MshQ
LLERARGGNASAQAAMLNLPALSGDFSAIVGGVFTGTAFSVDEVGILAATPKLSTNDYLGAGPPGVTVTTNIGRFYPDHFDTSTTAPMQCLTHMNCPSSVSGAAYSGQPFSVTVTPMNASGVALRNYNGVLARPITLSAFALAGGAAPSPAGNLSSNTIPVALIVANQPISATPIFSFPTAFTNAAPRALNWTAPTPIYLRASADDNIAGGTVTVTSLRGAASVEGGVTIVSGRLALDNPHGSELLKMPIRTEAQYWTTGGRWETSANDNASKVQSGGISFGNCLKNLGPPCKAAALGVTVNSLVPLVSGVGTIWLKAPGAGNNGSADVQMNNPAWLPSTIGRATFGVYKSPLIYLREVY